LAVSPNTLRRVAILAAALVSAPSLLAQAPRIQFPAASPGCTLKQRVGLTDIEITYSRPSMKGRKVFGGIVPYGQVWRTGANQSTRLTFSTDVKLNGIDVPAGQYALYTIPGEDEWTIILSKNTKLWGAYGYKQDDDLARFTVAPQSLGEPIESFTIELGQIRDDSAVIYLLWDTTVVPINLQLDVVKPLLPKIAAAMDAPGKKSPGLCYQAATFYYDHGQDLKKPLEWVNAALEGNTPMAFELLHLKAEILARLGNKAEAIAAAKKSTELALKAEGPSSSFVQMNKDIISSLQ
jgi:Protein of unknown function (DUF2911)